LQFCFRREIRDENNKMLLYQGIRVTENKTREGRAKEKDNAVTLQSSDGIP
jgi:hypothetical protein